MAEQRTAESEPTPVLAEAAKHDQWFRAAVEAALRKADSPEARWTDHAEVKENFAKRRAELVGAAGIELEENDSRLAG